MCYTGLFALTALVHLFQSVRYRAWWLLPSIVVAAFGETVGWAARLQSASNPTLKGPSIVQTLLLVLAPTPFVAALFMGFGKIVGGLGVQYSRLSPKLYSRIFLSCDILSLVVQGLGGGICASNTEDLDRIRLGSNITLGGLIFQILAMSVFCALMGEYAYRYTNDRPFRRATAQEKAAQHILDSNVKRLIGGILVSTALVYVRSVYRMAEFIEGFSGALAHNQVTFVIFDASLVAIALYMLNWCHPGKLLLRTAASGGQAFEAMLV
ncbi:RTA1 like protein [Epithele typhae]|uniref:RTA1 like protein n=1 Tax=Epithele typhae TaxID=378194 RepID=UPI0020079639|nr:RTA1 like protein [Epithele typhae]KAH9913670.1 RTA1 like protein [Epithele typhae]